MLELKGREPYPTSELFNKVEQHKTTFYYYSHLKNTRIPAKVISGGSGGVLLQQNNLRTEKAEIINSEPWLSKQPWQVAGVATAIVVDLGLREGETHKAVQGRILGGGTCISPTSGV